MSSKLDQIVKGAAPPGTSTSTVTSRASSPQPLAHSLPEMQVRPEPSSTSTSPTASSPPTSTATSTNTTTTPNSSYSSSSTGGPIHPTNTPLDPLTTLPSSPPQIYLNLLILEASLRSQYLVLRARRRQNSLFLTLLAAWNVFFFYALFLNPREDGRGLGGSVYWVVETAEKMALMGGVVTGVLVWGTGQWERGVRWPRRFLAHTNRGLRVVNCKVVVVKAGWLREGLGWLRCVWPWGGWWGEGGRYFTVEADSATAAGGVGAGEKRSHSNGGHSRSQSHSLSHAHAPQQQQHHHSELIREEDLAAGGDVLKLLLLPKPFSADFRENWETYRSEYWAAENARRATLLARLRRQEQQRAREMGGLVYWLGLSGLVRRPTVREADVERTHGLQQQQQQHQQWAEKGGDRPHAAAMHGRQMSERDARRLGVRRGESHSRNASRSSTPGDNTDDATRPPSRGSRRSSFIATEGRRRQRGSSSVGGVRGMTPAAGGAGAGQGAGRSGLGAMAEGTRLKRSSSGEEDRR